MEIYFDNAATTKPLDGVLAAYTNAARNYANPAAVHGLGLSAERAMKEAAEAIRSLLYCSPKDNLVFTSGGTEANNLAVMGIAGKTGRVITDSTEHPSVAESFKALAARGFEVVTVKPPEDVCGYTTDDTRLVSVMAVNNETGAVNDIAAIGAEIKRKNPKTLFHADGVQAFGKIPVNLANVDLYTFSAHKIHGLKGIGALFVKGGVNLSPIIRGGNHQRGLRAGTENAAAVTGFAEAATAAFERMDESREIVSAVKGKLENGVKALGGLINSPEGGSPYILNVSFPGVMPEALVTALSNEGVYISAGSACSSRETRKRNRYVTEYGWPKERAESAVRFSFSRFNTLEEAKRCLEILGVILPKIAKRSR